MKAIVIGASTTGKTTIIKLLSQQIKSVPIQESDQLITKLNGGTYPADSIYKMEVLAPKMVQQALSQEQIILFTNTHYFQIQDLRLAKQGGFQILLLRLAKATMLARNRHRVLHEGYDDLSVYFDSMISYQNQVIRSGLIDATIDCSQNLHVVVSQLVNLLKLS